jgi:hypothetical protein
MEDTRLGLVRPEFSEESDPKLISISGRSEMGEVTIGTAVSLQESMSTSLVEGISRMEGLVSFLLNLSMAPPVESFCRLASEVRPVLADTDLLKAFLDSVID